MSTKDWTPADWETYYAQRTAAYQDALECGDGAAADAALTDVLVGIEPLVRRVISEAMGARADADLAHDCWLSAVEVIMDHARRYTPTAANPAFSTWLLTSNGPLRTTVRRVLDQALTGDVFSKAELSMLRVAAGVKSQFVAEHGREPSLDELHPLVAERADAWARRLVAESKPELADWEFEAEVLHRLTKSGSAAALRSLEELLEVEGRHAVHADATEGGWDIVAADVAARAADAEPVDDNEPLSPLLAMAVAALSSSEAAVLRARMEDEERPVTEVAKEHGVSVHRVRSIAARSAATVSAPHAQFAFLAGVQDQFEEAPEEPPAPVHVASSAAADDMARARTLGVGARLALAAARSQR